MIARKKVEFGDFQTPSDLALEIAFFLRDNGEIADAIVEPTCGLGSFVTAAITAFPRAKNVFGFDINPQYVLEAERAAPKDHGRKIQFERQNFFRVDWDQFFSTLAGNILVIGNPPWVTNSALGSLGSDNLPKKTNFQGHNGFAAKTGKANFDISEWMLIRLMEALHRHVGCVAMLCKASTARKALRHAWLKKLNIAQCSLHLIDAKKHFDASVEACLLVIHTGVLEPAATAAVYSDLSFDRKISTLGLLGKDLVSDIGEYLRLQDIDGIPSYAWRSGVKHDAAEIMEFTIDNNEFINGRLEKYQLETTYLFPLLKSSDIANGRLTPSRYVLVTQRKPSDKTDQIKIVAPKTWAYLISHADVLDHRRSIIYAKRPRFSIFGVGDYTFSAWKVAISGLYKNFRFEVIGRCGGKPTVLDDTCYFIPCTSENEARFVCELLNSDVCQRFIRSLVFLDSKRPVTIDTLNRIDLKRVADHVNKAAQARKFLPAVVGFPGKQSLLLFKKNDDFLSGAFKQ